MATIVKLGKARGRKVTVEQEKELIRVYLEHGGEAAAELSSKYGVSPRYAASVASTMGLKRPRWRKGNRYLDNYVNHSVYTFHDPRWARARAVGVVVA